MEDAYGAAQPGVKSAGGRLEKHHAKFIFVFFKDTRSKKDESEKAPVKTLLKFFCYKYCDEVNAHPVQYHRTCKMDEMHKSIRNVLVEKGISRVERGDTCALNAASPLRE